jgi:nondiscriminating glutamyl-tRNA synthetase
VAHHLLALAEWNVETVKSAIQSAGQEAGKKGRELFQPIRAALTGRTHGPELPRIIEWLGRESAAQRLEAAARGRSS